MRTDYIGLLLTDSSETAMSFLEWRTAMNGVDANSNMQLIDGAISRLNTAIGGKADGFNFVAETGLLQLTSNGVPIEGATVVLNLDKYYTKDEMDLILLELEESFANNETLQNLMDTALGNLTWDEETRSLKMFNVSGDQVGDTITITGGGGGGSSANNAVINITNTTGWLSKSVAENADCFVSATWESIEDGYATGNGVLTVKVGGIVKMTSDVTQGEFRVNVAPFLSVGKNTVKLTVSDVYGNSKTINFTISVVSLSIESTFSDDIPFSGFITYTYTPKGNVDKNVHFILDDVEIGTEIVSVSGRQKTFTIETQEHGSHFFEVYFDAEIDGQTVESNHLYYDLICLKSGNTTPIISSAFNRTEIAQFETINIPYIVYDPSNPNTGIVLSANEDVVGELTVGRTEQIWSYRADESGDLILKIICGDTEKIFNLTVAETNIDVSAETENLELYLSSYGRSNQEAAPATWSYGDIECNFSGYNWVSDGWVQDDNGITTHRISGDARLEIPIRIFATDCRETGKTIEIEFATRDVLNYDATILECYSGDRGFKLTAQKALLKSAQSEIFTQYKEGEQLRLTLVVEKRAENRIIYIYLNGIMCGVAQYPDSDDFSQATPVTITAGSNECTIDLYTIRVYNNNLTRHQVLDNWIADTQDIEQKLARYNRNNVYDAYGTIIIDNLPSNLPYMVLEADTLPEYKGNKVTIGGYFVDNEDTSRSFEFEGAEGDVQGTSSQGYPRKNYKLKFKNGFIMGGSSKPTFALNNNCVPTDTFTFKTDYASSEGANNVELVKLYNDISPYRIPPQLVNSKIRQGIDGFPMVVFHDNGSGAVFVGKYNFNHDKGTPEVFGFADGDESWEIRNNTSERVLFQSADFSTDDWLNDFEARYPEDNTNHINLSTFISWVASTDQTKATNEALTESVTYDDVEYTTDSAEYRLAKFKNEFENYAVLDSAVFYYLFTELFLMVDSRAKNAFPTKYGTDKICWLPYDMDTAIGINNEGALVFGYWLEDTDHISSDDGAADVYNGQQSVLWINLREAFGDKIMAMYQKLRSDGVLSYDIVENAFEKHQEKWCEAIWNEDAYFKYLQPFIEANKDYLPMLQGSKSEQRKWWLYNRFRYIDSKYNAGDALSDFITLRGYAKDDITIEPYADIYATIKYGSYLEQTRALRGSTYTLECPLSNVNDTEIYIYSASQIKSIGDISGLKVGLADFSMATKLTSLKIGDVSSDYSNPNLTELTVGNNQLLQTIDVRNCNKLGTGKTQSVDLKGCTNIENVYFDGTSITGVELPNGGILKTLHLPQTVTNLTLQNQKALTDFVMPDYTNITTLYLENVSNAVNSREIFSAMPSGGRVRLVGIDWDFASIDEALLLYDKFDTMKGLDEFGNNTDKAQIFGTIYVPSLTGAQLNSLKSRYPYVNVEYDTISYLITYTNYDGSELYTAMVPEGGSAINPVTEDKIDAPTRPDESDTRYIFKDFGELPTDVRSDLTIVAQYTEIYLIRFMNDDIIYNSQWVTEGTSAVVPATNPTKANTAEYQYTFSHWNGTYTNVAAPADIIAVYTATKQKYTVYFYNGSTLLQTVPNVEYGSSATYTGTTPVDPDGNGAEFEGWNPTPTNITGNTSCYAVFAKACEVAEITDSWEQILASVADGTYKTKYRVGNYKPLDLGAQGTVNMQIAGFDKDTLTSGGTAPISWISKELLTSTQRMNPDLVTLYEYPNAPSWKAGSNNTWTTETQYCVDSIAKATWTVTATLGGVVTISYKTSNSNASRNKISVTVNGTPVATDFTGTTFETYDVTCNEGDTITVYAEYSLTYNGSYTGQIKFESTGTISIVADIQDAPKRTTSGYKTNTGSIGGWENTEMRSYLKNTIKPLIPEVVRLAIKEVNKTQPAFGTDGKQFTQTTSDDVWIPSYDEMFNNSRPYKALFPDNASRIKYKVGTTSAQWWWLRSACSTSGFNNVYTNGNNNDYSANSSGCVALGFCT